MDSIARHCAELDRCNQRDGRMLSVFDLIEAGTLDLDLAAYLMAQIAGGASFMVGARPGGAGKTTVMCALLNFIPAETQIVAATAQAVQTASRDSDGTSHCFVCHEIGSGPYFAYLWGRDLRSYCSLSQKDHVLATNLHADDLDEARNQVCDENGVPSDQFDAFQLAVFLRVHGSYSSARRRIGKVYASNGVENHTLVFEARSGVRPDITKDRWSLECRSFLSESYDAGVRTIEDTRKRVIEFLNHRKPSHGKRDNRP